MGRSPKPERPKKPPKGVGAMIAARRAVRGWTLQYLAERAGCGRSYLWMIERGQRAAPSDEILGKLEKSLGFESGELVAAARWESMPREARDRLLTLRGTERAAEKLAAVLRTGAVDAAHRSGELKRLVDEAEEGTKGRRDEGTKGQKQKEDASPFPSPSPLRPSVPSSLRPLPLINSVAAGYPREFTDLGYPAGVADQYVHVPGLTDADAFACRVVGDSMLPEYREGDIVVFSPTREVKSGMDCLARLEPDSETTFKRVYVEGEKGRETIRLQPLNPAYPARTLEREMVQGLFAAVSVTRAVGPP